MNFSIQKTTKVAVVMLLSIAVATMAFAAMPAKALVSSTDPVIVCLQKELKVGTPYLADNQGGTTFAYWDNEMGDRSIFVAAVNKCGADYLRPGNFSGGNLEALVHYASGGAYRYVYMWGNCNVADAMAYKNAGVRISNDLDCNFEQGQDVLQYKVDYRATGTMDLKHILFGTITLVPGMFLDGVGDGPHTNGYPLVIVKPTPTSIPTKPPIGDVVTKLICEPTQKVISHEGGSVKLHAILQNAAGGGPIANKVIHWSDLPGLGSVMSDTSITNSAGIATMIYTAPASNLGGTDAVKARFAEQNGDGVHYFSSSCNVDLEQVRVISTPTPTATPIPTLTPTPTPTTTPTPVVIVNENVINQHQNVVIEKQEVERVVVKKEHKQEKGKVAATIAPDPVYSPISVPVTAKTGAGVVSAFASTVLGSGGLIWTIRRRSN